MKNFTLCFAAAAALLCCGMKSQPADAAKTVPVQHNGQVKSLDAFARQLVSLVSGKETWNGKPAVRLVLDALADPGAAADVKWVKIGNKELVSHLGLPTDRSFFSFGEALPAADRIEALVQSSKTKRDRDLRPSMLEQKAESLFTALIEVKHLMSGESVNVIPPSATVAGALGGGEAWLSPYQAQTPLAAEFKEWVRLYGEGKQADFEAGVREWTREVHQLTGGRYKLKIDLEVLYLNLRPFEWSWIAYLGAFLLLSVLRAFPMSRPLGLALLAGAVLFHTLGLALRVAVLSRPPVSNMYESMVFMNWVLIIAALAFAAVRKNLAVASIGAFISAVIMIYADLLPLDPSLEVLVPVLRSNYWLTIHVLTIVSSYGVFGLAMGLGHRHIVLDVRGRLSGEEEARSAQLIFRVIQVGMLLLGVGTTLGGVWANESWGRFWGWDPKETWALITFLGYLVVVHLKLTKIMKPFALAVASILGFQFVLMTWYGVNFVLGRGLHSYGRGAGGMEWVVYYLVLETLFVGWALAAKLRNIRPI